MEPIIINGMNITFLSMQKVVGEPMSILETEEFGKINVYMAAIIDDKKLSLVSFDNEELKVESLYVYIANEVPNTGITKLEAFNDEKYNDIIMTLYLKNIKYLSPNVHSEELSKNN